MLIFYYGEFLILDRIMSEAPSLFFLSLKIR